MKVLGDEMSFERSVAIGYPKRGVRAFTDELAARLRVEPRDAEIDYSTGWVEIVPEQRGREVRVDDARRALNRALRRGGSHVTVPVEPLQPEVTRAAYDQVLLVRIGENKLYLYQDGRISHSWPVATGQPEYMTPTGVYEVTEKRYLPTWINPAPTTWGKDMPAEIPPGPGNPLGVRAINWSAPAIRFHGTEATYSLGYNASHGCVRMSNEDVVELYDMIDVGTPIVSLVAGSLNPLYVSSPDPTPVAGDGAGGE
jgi:lipoprotein-anchoring transpeptidase ErfK/SrfK